MRIAVCVAVVVGLSGVPMAAQEPKPVPEDSVRVFVPGCTATTVAPDDAKLGLAAVEGLTGAPVRPLTARCCGLPLLDAGDRQGFARSARAFVAELDGASRVVFQDPGCLHAIAKVAPAHGVRADGVALEHDPASAAARELFRSRLSPLQGYRTRRR